jgi:hypothetical protein
MKDVLDAVDDRRLLGAFQDVHDAFESQKCGQQCCGTHLCCVLRASCSARCSPASDRSMTSSRAASGVDGAARR